MTGIDTKTILATDLKSASIEHHGVKGQKWGVRKRRDTGSRESTSALSEAKVKAMSGAHAVKEKAISGAYGLGVHLAPREYKYSIKRALNKVGENVSYTADSTLKLASLSGKLPSNKAAMDAIEKVGIEKHKNAKYNLDAKDLGRLKAYTNAARYSRNINSYLATKEPKSYQTRADALKKTLDKTSVSDTTVFRSCNLKFSFNGVAKKLDTMDESSLLKSFDSFSKNYKGKTFKENRVFSTSTSPNFAIDTWRKVNPTAAKSYNTYMIIKTDKCPGLLADGRTTKGEKLVNTRSNQEAILAPDRMRYDSLAYDKQRGMFAITVTAMREK